MGDKVARMPDEIDFQLRQQDILQMEDWTKTSRMPRSAMSIRLLDTGGLIQHGHKNPAVRNG